MTIVDLVIALTEAAKESPLPDLQVVCKNPEGKFYRINFVRYENEAEEYQLLIAPL